MRTLVVFAAVALVAFVPNLRRSPVPFDFGWQRRLPEACRAIDENQRVPSCAMGP
jgi:hypothetical protein